MTDPVEKKRLEESLRRLSWWHGPTPGLWKHALDQNSLPRRSTARQLVALARSQWGWLVGAAAATIVIATVFEHAWRSSDDQLVPDHREAVVQTSPNQTAESAPSAGSLLLAAIPPFSGPIPSGWSPGLDAPSIVLAAGPGDRILAGEAPADRESFALGGQPGRYTPSRVDSFESPVPADSAEVKTTTTKRTLIVPAGRYN